MYIVPQKHPTTKYQEVADVQGWLNEIKTLDSQCTWARLDVDGYLGPITGQTIGKFQQIFLLRPPQCGILGDTTYNCIREKCIELRKKRYGTISAARPKISSSEPDIDWGEISRNFAKELANNLKGISESIEGELKRFRTKKISAQDVERLARQCFNRPNVEKMRQEMEKEYLKELHKTNKRAANRQYKHGLTSKSKILLEPRLRQQVLKKVSDELESANFSRKLTDACSKASKGKIKVNGGAIFTAISLVPMVWDFFVWRDAEDKNSPKAPAAFQKFIADIISFIEGVLIGVVVGLVVALIGLVGWVAVVAALVIGIVVGIFIEILFPEHNEWIAEKLISCYKCIVQSSALQNLKMPSNTIIQRGVGIAHPY